MVSGLSVHGALEYFVHIQSCYKIMSFLGVSGFFIMAAMHRLVANKSVEVLELVLGVKSIKTVLGNTTGKAAKFRSRS